MNSAAAHYAPGMRVQIRDAEWRIKRVDHSSDGGYVLNCEGVSELVLAREGLFLSRLEEIRILDPRNTELVGVGLPRKARKADLNEGIAYGIDAPGRQEQGIPLGWADVKDLQEGIVTKTFPDDTLPGGPVPRTIEYKPPFFRPDREQDYRIACEFFARNKEGTA